MSDYFDAPEKLYKKRTTPFWVDECGHGGYLFSYTAVTYPVVDGSRKTHTENIDVYCWEQPSSKDQEFCLRYGNKPNEYRSPGGIEGIFTSRDHEPYQGCMKLLRQLGNIRFVTMKEELLCVK
jgi:hypothetical protein